MMMPPLLFSSSWILLIITRSCKGLIFTSRLLSMAFN
jgi:hypothetical protein